MQRPSRPSSPVVYRSPATIHSPGPYSHLVAVPSGGLFFLSGQVAIGADGRLVGEGNLETQLDRALENLTLVLQSSGADFSSVVKLTIYVVGDDPTAVDLVDRAIRTRLPADRLPANTLVRVSGLARPDLLVEVDAIALAPRRS